MRKLNDNNLCFNNLVNTEFSYLVSKLKGFVGNRLHLSHSFKLSSLDFSRFSVYFFLSKYMLANRISGKAFFFFGLTNKKDSFYFLQKIYHTNKSGCLLMHKY